MNPARRLAAWTLPRSFLVADLLMMAQERDRWRRTAEDARRLLEEAVAVAHRYHEQAEADRARCDSLVADWDRMVTG